MTRLACGSSTIPRPRRPRPPRGGFRGRVPALGGGEPDEPEESPPRASLGRPFGLGGRGITRNKGKFLDAGRPSKSRN
jgi:hypothetical protein